MEKITLKQQPAGKFTEEEIEIWKKQFGEVFLIEVQKESGGGESDTHRGYFRKPTREVMGNSMRFAERDPFKSGEILFNGCLIACDIEMKEDVVVYMSALSRLNSLLEVRKSEIKKL